MYVASRRRVDDCGGGAERHDGEHDCKHKKSGAVGAPASLFILFLVPSRRTLVIRTPASLIRGVYLRQLLSMACDMFYRD